MPAMVTSLPFWHIVTRLGEAEILLPATLALCWWLARRAEFRPLVHRWLAWIALGAIVTTASKVAFMGWGVGSATLNFTGISGHAMFAAAVYPPFLYSMAATRSAAWRRLAWLAGCALAVVIAVSRVMVGAHSWSEVIAGLLLGGMVSASVSWMAGRQQAAPPIWLPVGLACWLAITPAQAPPSATHGMVTRLALSLSGRSQPHTRAELHREQQTQLTDVGHRAGLQQTAVGDAEVARGRCITEGDFVDT